MGRASGGRAGWAGQFCVSEWGQGLCRAFSLLAILQSLPQCQRAGVSAETLCTLLLLLQPQAAPALPLPGASPLLLWQSSVKEQESLLHRFALCCCFLCYSGLAPALPLPGASPLLLWGGPLARGLCGLLGRLLPLACSWLLAGRHRPLPKRGQAKLARVQRQLKAFLNQGVVRCVRSSSASPAGSSPLLTALITPTDLRREPAGWCDSSEASCEGIQKSQRSQLC